MGVTRVHFWQGSAGVKTLNSEQATGVPLEISATSQIFKKSVRGIGEDNVGVQLENNWGTNELG